MIEVRNIDKYFGEHHVLKNVSAIFEASKINMIIGKSGSGKTVLLKSIIGLHTPENGEIFFDNREFIHTN